MVFFTFDRSLDELWILTRAVRRRGANRSGWHHEMHYPAATCVYRTDHPDLLHGVPTDDAGELPGQHPRGKCRHHEIGRCSSGRRDAGRALRSSRLTIPVSCRLYRRKRGQMLRRKNLPRHLLLPNPPSHSLLLLPLLLSSRPRRSS